MRTTLIALSVGGAMLGGAGIAQADTIATDGQTKMSTVEHSQARAPVILTDDQMQKLTAGHTRGQNPPSHHNWHWGSFDWKDSGNRWQSNWGWHRS
jgi:hypothetical protein